MSDMSRFHNLEFGQHEDNSSGGQFQAHDEHFFLGEAKAAFEGGRFDEALRAFAKVLEFNPQNAAAWTGQVKALVELGEFPEAKLWAEKALETFPHEADLLAAKAVALGRLGDLKGALAYSDAAMQERGSTPYVWLARADVLLARKEQRAEHCFEKAWQLAPVEWTVRWLAARIQFYHGKFALALKAAQTALNMDSTRAVIWLEVARCQQELGLITLAESSFTQALQLDPQCQGARRGLDKLADAGGFWARLRGRWRLLFP